MCVVSPHGGAAAVRTPHHLQPIRGCSGLVGSQAGASAAGRLVVFVDAGIAVSVTGLLGSDESS